MDVNGFQGAGGPPRDYLTWAALFFRGQEQEQGLPDEVKAYLNAHEWEISTPTDVQRLLTQYKMKR